jgi:acyl-CoA reductase-like NAD-dependent aldehyde dehydrogenase
MDQPKSRRDHKSSTAGRKSQPSPVRTWVTSAAFGGCKQSGWGREMGHEVLEAYTEVKSVCSALY